MLWTDLSSDSPPLNDRTREPVSLPQGPRRTPESSFSATALPGVATLDAAPGQASLSLFGRNCVHGPALTLAREHEALVALLGDLGALPAVPADAFRPEVGQEAARLAGDVGSHVPGIGVRHQGRVHDLGDMGAPRVLRLRDRL